MLCSSALDVGHGCLVLDLGRFLPSALPGLLHTPTFLSLLCINIYKGFTMFKRQASRRLRRGAVEVVSTLQGHWPEPRETAPASRALFTLGDCERMLWEGFRLQSTKARLAQGLEGTPDAEGATAGNLPLIAQGAGWSPRGLDGQEAHAGPRRAESHSARPSDGHEVDAGPKRPEAWFQRRPDGQEPDAGPQRAEVSGADSDIQSLEDNVAKGAAGWATLEGRPGGPEILSEEVKALDTSEWGKDWSWRDRPEFKPVGEQPQGWRWVLARLRALAVEDRGPWLRTLTWQDRILGCAQQVCQEYEDTKPCHKSFKYLPAKRRVRQLHKGFKSAFIETR
jgi:hypothetical protein